MYILHYFQTGGTSALPCFDW